MAEILAWNEVMERLDNDKELFIELVNMFFASYPADVAKLENSIRTSNSELIRNQAHAIKSALGNLGAMRCHELAFKLESMARASNLAGIDQVFAEFKAAVEEFRVAAQI